MKTQLQVRTKLNSGYWLDDSWEAGVYAAKVQEVHEIGQGASPLEAVSDLKRRLERFHKIITQTVSKNGSFFLEIQN